MIKLESAVITDEMIERAATRPRPYLPWKYDGPGKAIAIVEIILDAAIAIVEIILDAACAPVEATAAIAAPRTQATTSDRRPTSAAIAAVDRYGAAVRASMAEHYLRDSGDEYAVEQSNAKRAVADARSWLLDDLARLEAVAEIAREFTHVTGPLDRTRACEQLRAALSFLETGP